MHPGTAGGHGPFSDADIRQIMAETGYSYDRVCRDIDQTQATSKEQLYPQFYAGEGIQPQDGTAAPVPAPPAAAAPVAAAVPPTVTPAPEGTPVENQTSVTDSDALPPEAVAAMHDAMAPPNQPPMDSGPRTEPAWRQRLARKQRY